MVYKIKKMLSGYSLTLGKQIYNGLKMKEVSFLIKLYGC